MQALVKSYREPATLWKTDLNSAAKALLSGLSVILLTAGCSSSATITNPNFQKDLDSDSQASNSSSQESASPAPSATLEVNPEKQMEKSLSVVETHFWPSDDYQRWNFVAYIENPNEDFAWIFERFAFEAFDSEGVLLDSSSEYATIMPKSTEVFYGYWFDIGNNIVSEINVRGTTSGSLLSSTPGFFKVENIEYSTGRFSSEVSGVLVSNFEEDQESVEVVIVIRDSTGKILTADNGYVSRVPAGGKARFEVSLFDFEVRDSMKIEVHPKL
jgi:hypothetical protein